MKVAIHGRKFNEQVSPYVKLIFDTLATHNAQVCISEKFVNLNKDTRHLFDKYSHYNNLNDLNDVDFVFSVGGDGTLLEAVTQVGHLEIPILGINMGRLGFLATIAKESIKEALELFFDQKFTHDKRMLIHVDTNKDIFKGQNFGLNEVALLKRDTASMIIVHCYIDGEFVNTYWADGLMVSTPTGSTGYSLSCGGPLVQPQSDSFIITPISPHNLNVRPLIVSSDSTISFQIEGKGRNFLTSLDSRSYTVDNTIQLSVKKEKFKAVLVQPHGFSFFETLRHKLNWGLDIRN